MNQLTESVNHTISRLPTALPVVVIEAIPSDLSLISTNILENGWAILVCGRRLFAWNYSQTSSVIKACYELQLPASDIAHKADLACLLFSTEKNTTNSIPALIAVSPEGLIRFWPKIANSNNSIEVIANELQGQECNSLVSLKPFGCILSTTTNTLMQVNINYGGTSLNDSNMITCRLLKIPQGLFAGFKKFSSFIFGGTPNSHYNFDNKNYLVKVLQGRKHSNYTEIIVFTGNVMQLFEIGYNSDKLIIELDMDRILKEGVLRMVLINGATQIDQLNLWIIDAKYKSNDEIVLIFACLIKNSVHMNYVLATLIPELSCSSQTSASSTINAKYTIKSMNLLRNYTSPAELNDQTDQSFLNLHLVEETAYPQLHYIHDRQKVICVQEGNDVVDTIFFNNSDNEILGIGVWEQQPLIFTSKDSLIALTPSDELISLNSSINQHIADADLNESDKYYWLKKAFQTYRKKDLQLSQQLVKDNFLGDLTLDFELDKNVIMMSEELIDSTPNSASIQTVDTLKLAQIINKDWSKDEPLNYFIQVNTSGEENKSGINPDDVIDFVKQVQEKCPKLAFTGLMTIGALATSLQRDGNEDFDCLVHCRKEISEKLDIDIKQIKLSMGMSNDFEQAIIKGSNYVRVGTSIFGERNPKK